MRPDATNKGRMTTSWSYGLAHYFRTCDISSNRRNFGMWIGQGITWNRIWERYKFLFRSKLGFTRGLLLTITPGNFAERFILWISIVRSLLRVLFCARARLLTLASLDTCLIVGGQNRFVLQILFRVNVTCGVVLRSFPGFFLPRSFGRILPSGPDCGGRNQEQANENRFAPVTRGPPSCTTGSHQYTPTMLMSVQ